MSFIATMVRVLTPDAMKNGEGIVDGVPTIRKCASGLAGARGGKLFGRIFDDE